MPHSVKVREDHLTNYLHNMLQVGQSDSLYFKNISLPYLVFLLHWEQIFSSDIRRTVLLTHPSPYFKQTVLISHPWEYFTCTTMGLVLPFYLHSGEQPKSFLALFDLVPETWYLTPTRRNPLRSSMTKEESGRSWKIFYKSTLHHIATHFMNLCKLSNPVQTL